MISFSKLICLLISLVISFIIITASTGITYMNGFNSRQNFYPVNVTQYPTYLNVSLPKDVIIIWFPNEPAEYIIYDKNITDIYVKHNTYGLIDENIYTYEGCLNVCYSFIAYYDVNTRLITICDEESRTDDNNNKPVYKFCDYSNITLFIVFMVFLMLTILVLIATPFIIIGYTQRYKKPDYDAIN